MGAPPDPCPTDLSRLERSQIQGRRRGYRPCPVIPDCAPLRATPESISRVLSVAISPGTKSSVDPHRSDYGFRARAEPVIGPAGGRTRCAPRNDERETVTAARGDRLCSAVAATFICVMRGLDPRIHRARRRAILRRVMDCRVKPGNDGDVSERPLDERSDTRVSRNGGRARHPVQRHRLAHLSGSIPEYKWVRGGVG